VYENWVLRRRFGTKREEVTEGAIKLHDTLDNRWSGHVAHIGNIKLKLSLRFNCAPRHEVGWGSGGIAPRILWPQHYMEVSGQLHAPAALPPGKEPLMPIG
jgi:hypothetical protein